MTGKEFFGKLLSNRHDTPEPWDRDDSPDGLTATELDDDPTYDEDVDLAGAPGGDGQSSALPEVRPSVPYSSDVDPHAETPASSILDESPVHPLTSTEQYEIESEMMDLEASASSGMNSADADTHVWDESTDSMDGSPDPMPSNGEYADRELQAAAPAWTNGRYADEELPAAPEPSNGRYADHELRAEPTPLNSRSADKDVPPVPASTNGRYADQEISAERASSNGREAAAADMSSARSGSHGSTSDNDARAAEASDSNGMPDEARARLDSNGTPADAPRTETQASTDGRHTASAPRTAPASNTEPAPSTAAAPVPNIAAAPNIERTPDASAASASAAAPAPDAPSASAAAPAPAKRREGDASMRPARERSAASAAPAQRTEQSDKRGRSDAPPPSKPVRKEPDSSRGRAKAAVSSTGDVEIRGIKDRVVIRLLDKKLVSEVHVKAALRERNKDKLKATLWRIVAHQKGVNREAIYREAALTYAFVERKLEEKDVDLEFVRQVADVFPEKRRNRLIELRVVPVGYEFEQQTQMLRVVFLTHDPSLPAVRELMQELNLERYELQYAPELVVKDLLGKAFPRKNEYLERMSEDPLAYDLGMSYEEDKGELIDEEALEAEINRSSLINLFEAALVESVHKGASDIHIYPNAKRQVEIHFRVDGRLILWHLEDKVHPESLLAVIKDNTMNVDRFERDMAQDGFIQRKVDDTIIRYRVSILPIATAQQSLHAESIVIRVLDDRKVLTDLSQLGLLEGALERFDMAIRQPHGMVILTGPTGSGKSTTLVAALHQVVNPEINVLTVEDPVEYIIPSVRQIKLNHKLNLEQALRSILRHDPDVVMVGEMRDRPTAELAIKLANTGHLTFSTLHTNDAPSAVSRLYKMGVEPFLIAYAINLIVAQRLIRSLCPTCKVVDADPDPVLLDRLGFTSKDLTATTFYKPSGDPTCKTCKGIGYTGRRAISEALYFSRAIRHMVVEADTKIDEDALREAARKEGMLTLQDSAREVVKMGETSVDEMMRVTATEE